MSRVIANVRDGVQALKPSRGYRYGVGSTITYRWIGTQQECEGKLASLIDTGGVKDASIEHEEAGFFILSATYSSESPTGAGGVEDAAGVSTIWTRDPQRSEKTLWTAPAWIALSNSLRDEYAAVGLRAAIEDYLAGQATIATLSKVLVANGLTLENETVSRLIEHYRKGIESYPVQTWVFRRTQSGPVGYLANDDATIGRLWSKASFIAQSTMPDWIKPFVPNGFFLQGGAQISEQDKFRVQVLTDWEYFTEFPEWIYGNAI